MFNTKDCTMKFLLLLTIGALLFSGCEVAEEHSAKVIDSEVNGLEYQCAGIFKYTDKNGTLSCNHMPIAFMLGQIKLGLLYEIPQDSIILPQDIANVPREDADNENVIKILTILQSLDSDQNPENGITIPKEIGKKLTTYIDIKKMNIAEIQELIEAQLGKTIEFKEPQQTLLHLNNSMIRYNLPELKSEILEKFGAIDLEEDNTTHENNETIENNQTLEKSGTRENNASYENNSTYGHF